MNIERQIGNRSIGFFLNLWNGAEGDVEEQVSHYMRGRCLGQQQRKIEPTFSL